MHNEIENKEVALNTFLQTSNILFLYDFAAKLVNSGMSKLLKDIMKTVGKVRTAIDIPLIFPYSDNAILYVNPNNIRREGIINCFKVDKPERMHEVADTGKAILKIFLLKVIPKIAL